MSGLSPDIERYVQQKVASGRFASSEEFASEAIRLYRDLEGRHELLKADIQAARQQSDSGQSEPLDAASIKQELVDELDEHGRPK